METNTTTDNTVAPSGTVETFRQDSSAAVLVP